MNPLILNYSPSKGAHEVIDPVRLLLDRDHCGDGSRVRSFDATDRGGAGGAGQSSSDEPNPFPLTVLEVELQLHHHVAALHRDVQQQVPIARGQRRGDSILKTQNLQHAGRVERHDRPAQIIEAVEHRARPDDVHDLEELALVVLVGLFVAGVW